MSTTVADQYKTVVDKGLVERFDGMVAFDLSTAMAAGAEASEKAEGWGDGEAQACALHGAYAIAVNAATN